jgi:hypothetical protein
MENHEVMDVKQYDDLMHLESVLDIEFGGKDIVVRLDLDVPLSAYTPPSTQDQTGILSHSNTEELKLKGGAAVSGKKGQKGGMEPV